MKWFKVEMDIGVEDDAEIPNEGELMFLKWLESEQVKYVGGLVLRPAVLETAG